jgi:hypothetical protein
MDLELKSLAFDSKSKDFNFKSEDFILKSEDSGLKSTAFKLKSSSLGLKSPDSGLRSNELGGKSERFESHLRASQILLKIGANEQHPHHLTKTNCVPVSFACERYRFVIRIGS